MRDLIILIIVVAISIISSVVKANKKAKERRNIPQPNDYDTIENDPWDDLIRETESSESKQSPEPAYVYESTSNQGTELTEIESVIRKRNEDVAKRYENKKQSSPIFNDDIQSSSVGHEDLKDKVLHDFNVVDAVIYSEILKPKF